MSYLYKAELELLGVKRVRKGMRAFTEGASHDCGGMCFLGFAFARSGASRSERNHAYIRNGCLGRAHPFEGVEAAFENGWGIDPAAKHTLYQSCLLYLAEHGEIPEPVVFGVAGKATT